MLHKLLSCLVMGTLLSLVSGRPAFAKYQDQNPERTRQVKVKVEKLSERPKSRIKVKLDDGRKLRGNISEVAEDYFVLVDSKAGAATTVRYTQVQEVERSKPSGVLAIVVATGALAAVIIAFLISPGS